MEVSLQIQPSLHLPPPLLLSQDLKQPRSYSRFLICMAAATMRPDGSFMAEFQTTTNL